MKKYFFYFVLILIPILFFVLLEGALRIFNYGKDYSTFVVISEISDQYFLNPLLPEKYFVSTEVTPSVIPDPFDKIKYENTIRIFIFGGSTTAGFPYSPNASFPRLVKRKIEMYYPAHRVEVINLGVSAVNTYFIRDIIDDVIEQQPDLLLFYTGHNEFYGALGPASTEFISGSPATVNLILKLREYKVYQLMTNLINSIWNLFGEEKLESRSTLMETMIAEQEIDSDSEIFRDGLAQFEQNMEAVLNKCSKHNIPVLIGNLVSNLKQKPLQISEGVAQEYFYEAMQKLDEENFTEAKELFLKAKDNDLLKFRAVEEFNYIINKLAKRFDADIVDIKNGFESASENSIVDNKLMVDHLHPKLEGYKLMGEIFFEVTDNYLMAKFGKEKNVASSAINKYLKENFPFTRYDSTLAAIKIDILLNSFPFTQDRNYNYKQFPLENYPDTLAMESIEKGLGWAAAHVKLFDYHFRRKEFSEAYKTLFSLMEDRPFYKSALYYGIEKLLSVNYIKQAKHILVRNHRRLPDKFTSNELGKINLNEGNINLANKLFNEALRYSPTDPEIYYNLSRTYYALQDLPNAIKHIESCLAISPDYPSAKNIYEQLKLLHSSNKK